MVFIIIIIDRIKATKRHHISLFTLNFNIIFTRLHKYIFVLFKYSKSNFVSLHGHVTSSIHFFVKHASKISHMQQSLGSTFVG